MKKGYLLFLVLGLTACSAGLNPIPPATATDTAVPTSTAIPSPTATPTPTPVPNGPCDNPLVPLAVGNEWTYRVTTDSGQSLFTLKSLERQDAANVVVLVEFTDQKNGLTLREPVICREGAIQDFPLYVMDMFFTDFLNKLLNTARTQGVYAPAYSSLAEANWITDWQAEYVDEEAVRFKSPTQDTSMYLSNGNSIELSFHMDGSREPVSVPAGEFPQAIKVSQRFITPATVNLPVIGDAGAALSVDTTQWYEPYVGLVRAQVDVVNIDVSAPINMPMKSIIELMEFKKGN